MHITPKTKIPQKEKGKKRKTGNANRQEQNEKPKETTAEGTKRKKSYTPKTNKKSVVAETDPGKKGFDSLRQS